MKRLMNKFILFEKTIVRQVARKKFSFYYTYGGIII